MKTAEPYKVDDMTGYKTFRLEDEQSTAYYFDYLPFIDGGETVMWAKTYLFDDSMPSRKDKLNIGFHTSYNGPEGWSFTANVSNEDLSVEFRHHESGFKSFHSLRPNRIARKVAKEYIKKNHDSIEKP